MCSSDHVSKKTNSETKLELGYWAGGWSSEPHTDQEAVPFISVREKQLRGNTRPLKHNRVNTGRVK